MSGLPLIGQADPGQVSTTTRIVAVIVTVVLLGLVIELVRRRRLVERYALLWILAALAMVVLAVWRNGLDVVRDVLGIGDPVNALFLIAFGVVFALLLHFSVAISRLGEETKILGQEVARLDAELRRERGELPSPNGGRGAGADDPGDGSERRAVDQPAGPAEDRPERPAPSSARTADQ